MIELVLTKEKFDELEQIISANKHKKGALIPILNEAQKIFGYVPIEVQKKISENLDIALAEIYGVVTFYSQFTLQPKGKHAIGVCLGTACYVKGSQQVLERLKRELNIEVGETTPDGKFTLEATRCIGACGLAPVMTINNDVYGRLVEKDIPDIIKKY